LLQERSQKEKEMKSNEIRQPLYSPKINWKVRCEEAESKLKEISRKYDTLMKEHEYAMNTSVKQQQVNTLTLENTQLKQLTVSMKEEILSLHSQIDEIQRSAFQAMNSLQNQNLQSSQHTHHPFTSFSSSKPEPERNHDNEDSMNDYLQLFSSTSLSSPFKPVRHSSLVMNPAVFTPSAAAFPVSLQDISENNSNSTNEERKKKPLNQNDWAYHHLHILSSFMPSSLFSSTAFGSSSSSYNLSPALDHPHLFSLIHSFRWSFIEVTIFEKVYNLCYIPGKDGVTFSSFLRLCKDLKIFITANHEGDNLSTLSLADDMIDGINNGDLAMIFTMVSLINTDNNDNDNHNITTTTPNTSLPPPPATSSALSVFSPTTISSTHKSVSGGGSVISKISGGQETSTVLSKQKSVKSPLGAKVNTNFHVSDIVSNIGINNNAINIVIKKKQFFIALQMLANKLYLTIVQQKRQVINEVSEQTTMLIRVDILRKQKDDERIALELLFLKVIVPVLITHGNSFLFVLFLSFLYSILPSVSLCSYRNGSLVIGVL
jgi:hypothetical protein